MVSDHLITITSKLRHVEHGPKQRSTAQGGVIRQALGKTERFCSAQELYARLRAQGTPVGLSTVYRHLQALAAQGDADVIHTPDGETTYRLCGAPVDSAHHHHLVCRSCGRAEQVEGRAVERWAREVADNWQPWRTVATWYLWRSLDPLPVDY